MAGNPIKRPLHDRSLSGRIPDVSTNASATHIPCPYDGEIVAAYATLQGAVSQVDAVAASGVLTLTGQPLEGETLTIGETTYMFRSVPVLPYEVDIGSDVTESLVHLAGAITYDGGEGTGEGSDYGTGTEAHPDVTAESATDTLTATALVAGVAGNAIATTAVAGLASGWGGETLENGAEAVGAVLTVRVGATTVGTITIIDPDTSAGSTVPMDMAAGLKSVDAGDSLSATSDGGTSDTAAADITFVIRA